MNAQSEAKPKVEHRELQATVDELLMLVRESAEFHGDGDVQAVLMEAARGIIKLRRRLVVARDRYVVGVVGLTNVGKSTMLNALLGAELAPRRNGPCTAAPIEFVYGEAFRVTAFHQRSFSRPCWQCRDIEEVHRRLASIADDAGEQVSREVRKVVVEAPIPLLDHGLIIADTPGFGAAQTTDAAGSHEEALKRYLHDDVSQVFWVVLAEQGIGRRETAFHDAFFGEVCDDIVVTGCEDWEPEDRNRFRRRFCEHLGTGGRRFHFVSGLKGLKARSAQDAAGLEAAGITLLEQRIRELADPSGRCEAVKNSLLDLARELGLWLSEYRTPRRERLEPTWRPDSWGRWTASASTTNLRRQLVAALETHS